MAAPDSALGGYSRIAEPELIFNNGGQHKHPLLGLIQHGPYGLNLAMWATVEFNGLPHFRWQYSWVDQGQGYDPFSYRYYTDCTFWGPYGTFTIYPADGQCAWFQLFLEGESS